MNADSLTTALAESKQLSFISDPGILDLQEAAAGSLVCLKGGQNLSLCAILHTG